jgi:hypothetical protein
LRSERRHTSNDESPVTESVSAANKGTGTVRGNVKYPWGTVKNAEVLVGDRSAVTDQNGNYELTDVVAGSCNVTAKARFPGYEAPIQNVEIVGGETKVVDIYLDFVRAVVEGNVYDPEGKPLAGAGVSGVFCGNDAEEATSNERGYFKFDRASVGAQFIRVNAPGFMSETREFRTKQGETTTFEFHLNRATCRVRGTVKGKDGRVLSAVVNLRSSSGIIIAKTKSDAETGHYEFMVLPGLYDLLAEEPDHQYEGWRGVVSGETEVDFELEPDVPRTQRERG